MRRMPLIIIITIMPIDGIDDNVDNDDNDDHGDEYYHDANDNDGNDDNVDNDDIGDRTNMPMMTMMTLRVTMMTIMTYVYNDDNHANEDNDDKRWRCRANYGLCMDAWPCAATVAMDGMAGPGWPGQLWLCVAMHGHAMHRHGWQGLGLRRCMAIDVHGYAPLRIAMDNHG